MNNIPAFPMFNVDDGKKSNSGMTLRDYFAAHIMSGLLSTDGVYDPKHYAKTAYEYADAMLKERGAK